MKKSIWLANITVEEMSKGKPKQTTFMNVSHVEGAEVYKNKKIVALDKICVLGKTQY